MRIIARTEFWLGTNINPRGILSLKGDAEQGRRLFFEAPAIQCKTCHQTSTSTNSGLGPDLTKLPKKYTRAEQLESLLHPSKVVDSKFFKLHLENIYALTG
jgi:cytochrome c2